MRIREATGDDLAFLQQMWHAAAFWQPEVFTLPAEDALRIPEVARYIAGWGRTGDTALIAEIDGERVGAGWYRTFTAEEPGYGFVDESTPEIALAVEAGFRGRGIGTALVHELIAAAKREGRPALSLSVNAANPSRRIYERCGFVDVASDDDSYVMLLRL